MLGCDRDGLRGRRAVPRAAARRAGGRALGAALRAACARPRSASINLLLGQADRARPANSSTSNSCPATPAGCTRSDGVLAHANHLETPLPVHDVIKATGGSSLFRAARARRLLAEVAAERKVTADDLIAVFRDHRAARCRSAGTSTSGTRRWSGAETLYSVLLDLDARRLAVAAGPPCGHDYTWLDL